VFQRRLFSSDRGIFGGDDVDPRIRSCGCVDYDFATRQIDQLIAGTQSAALAADRLVGQQAKTLELVVEQDVEAVARLCRGSGLGQPVTQFIAYQPPGTPLDRGDFHCRQPARNASAAAPGIHRLEAAPGEAKRGNQGAYASHATILTNLSGTTITLRTSAPS